MFNEVRLANFRSEISNGKLAICNKVFKSKPTSRGLGDILTNRSSKLDMGKHSRAVDNIVVHVLVSLSVGFIIQHIVSDSLITQLL
jgi:hypothetical protein